MIPVSEVSTRPGGGERVRLHNFFLEGKEEKRILGRAFLHESPRTMGRHRLRLV